MHFENVSYYSTSIKHTIIIYICIKMEMYIFRMKRSVNAPPAATETRTPFTVHPLAVPSGINHISCKSSRCWDCSPDSSSIFFVTPLPSFSPPDSRPVVWCFQTKIKSFFKKKRKKRRKARDPIPPNPTSRLHTEQYRRIFSVPSIPGPH